MNYANYGLSQKLHQLTIGKWDTGTHFGADGMGAIPKYDLEYLMSKLPDDVYDDDRPATSGQYKDGKWFCGYAFGISCSADTPEDAAAKLCIELIEQKVIEV